MELSIQHYFEFLSLLTCILCMGKLRNSFMATFLPYLFVILVVELVCKYLYLNYKYNTSWIVNMLNLFSNGFYAFIFYHYSSNTKHKLLILWSVGSYVVLALIYHATVNFFEFNNYIVAIGGVLQVFFACFHFYHYLQNDENVKEGYYNAGLFIAAGVLIFYSGITIVFSLYHYIRLKELKLFDLELYKLVPRYLSILLYLLISIALIIWKKPKKILP